MLNTQLIPIRFGFRWLIFFIFLETLTVPLVAVSNHIVIKSIWYMASMGFVVAFICVFFLIKVLKNLLIKHSESLLGIKLTNIYGLWYIGLLAGLLLMVMFFVQNTCFGYLHWDDYRTGFVSAFLSVAITLSFYRLLGKLLNFYITFNYEQQIYRVSFRNRDIFILAIMFGLYEFIVCPITGLWIPYPDHRFSLGVISGILGGAAGGLLLVLISRFIPWAPGFTIEID